MGVPLRSGDRVVGVLGLVHVEAGKGFSDDDAARHDSYIASYLRTNVAKVIGSTRLVLAKTVDGNLLPVNLSISKAVNPDNADDILFTVDLPKTRSGKIMRRLLRDIAEGKALGDTTTLADPAVVARLKSEYEEKE